LYDFLRQPAVFAEGVASRIEFNTTFVALKFCISSQLNPLKDRHLRSIRTPQNRDNLAFFFANRDKLAFFFANQDKLPVFFAKLF